MSDVRVPTSGFLFVALSLGVTAGAAGAQDIGPISFRDSLVMRQVAYRAPCPAPAPRSWTLVDGTLGSGLRLSKSNGSSVRLRKATMIASSSMLSTVEWTSVGPVGKSLTAVRLLPSLRGVACGPTSQLSPG